MGAPQLQQVLIDGQVWFGYVHNRAITFDPSQLPTLPREFTDLVDEQAAMGKAVWQYRNEWWTIPMQTYTTAVRGNVYTTRRDLPSLTSKPGWWVDDTDALVVRLTDAKGE